MLFGACKSLAIQPVQGAANGRDGDATRLLLTLLFFGKSKLRNGNRHTPHLTQIQSSYRHYVALKSVVWMSGSIKYSALRILSRGEPACTFPVDA